MPAGPDYGAESPRCTRLYQLDSSILKRSSIKLTTKLSNRLTGLLISLRTRHVPLNPHLHHLGKSDTPRCSHCPSIDKSLVHHFLFDS
ncbi:hypothetical protein M405DRAFT_332756 [Rhizopogon salebrosus TDB-379]|jgi:hypothetical protein|nr:hypothetical protein M405DRAFT_332756 [Rhizopogon salebrosus TDB-379]